MIDALVTHRHGHRIPSHPPPALATFRPRYALVQPTDDPSAEEGAGDEQRKAAPFP